MQYKLIFFLFFTTLTACSKGTTQVVFSTTDTTHNEEMCEYRNLKKWLGQRLEAEKVILPEGITHKTMQGFGLDEKNRIYVSWEEEGVMRVRKLGGEDVGDMILPASGHGDGFCMEEGREKRLFWTSVTLGRGQGNYTGAKAMDEGVRLIGRFAFAGGKTQFAADAIQLFYLNDNGCRMVGVDVKHDKMACWTYEDGKEYIVVFRLNDVLSAPIIRMVDSRDGEKELQVHDLRQIEAMSKFEIDRKELCGVDGDAPKAVQGFCLWHDRIYLGAGYKKDDAATISVLDLRGKVIAGRLQVGVCLDKALLKKLGLSYDGSFEPEGVHFYGGKMYLGFVGDFPDKNHPKKSCVIRLDEVCSRRLTAF